MRPDLYSLNDIGLVKQGHALLSQLTVKIPPGIIAVLGCNGSGKTTLLRILAGIQSPSTGRILYGQRPLSAWNLIEKAKEIAWMPQGLPPVFPLKVLDVVILGRYAWHRGKPKAQDAIAAQRALEMVGLKDFASRSFNRLSGGERVRVDLARALASECRTILLDEPCANLDPCAQMNLAQVVTDLAADGRSFILSSHDLAFCRDLCTGFIALRDGRLCEEGSIEATGREGFFHHVYGS